MNEPPLKKSKPGGLSIECDFKSLDVKDLFDEAIGMTKIILSSAEIQILFSLMKQRATTIVGDRQDQLHHQKKHYLHIFNVARCFKPRRRFLRLLRKY